MTLDDLCRMTSRIRTPKNSGTQIVVHDSGGNLAQAIDLVSIDLVQNPDETYRQATADDPPEALRGKAFMIEAGTDTD